MTAPTQKLLDTVLVTGGCGFLGYALVRHLLDDPECGSVHVMDRETSRNRHDGAHYLGCDICDEAAMDKLLTKIQPTVVFHLASPNFCFPTEGRADFYRTNVKGTEILLSLSAKCTSTRAFVNCSSVDIYSGGPHLDADETYPTCISDPREPYNHTKALADSLVLAADSPRLRTVSLRLAHMYGARCGQEMRVLLDVCARKAPLIQLGPGGNVMSVVSVDNAAAAHVLAAKALLDPARAPGKVNGEAINISDGEPVGFWEHTTLFWSAARGRSVKGKLIVVPAWLAKFIFGFVQWVFWIFTLGRVEPPPNFGSTAISWALEDHTYSSKKAREILGFRPVSDHDAVVRRAVEEELQRREVEKSRKL